MPIDKCIADAMKEIEAAEAFVVDYVAKTTRTPPKYVYFLTGLFYNQEAFYKLADDRRDVAIALTWLISLTEIRQVLQSAPR